MTDYLAIDYTVTYGTDQGQQGIAGHRLITQNGLEVTGLLLGTCSADGCTYRTGISTVNLKIILTGNSLLTLTKTINLSN